MKGSLTISRPTYGNGKEKIRISVRDKASRGQFLEVEIGYAEFAAALTGMSEMDMDFEVYGLSNVGKFRVVEKRSIVFPGRCYNRVEMEKWLDENGKEEGWIVNSYLGSQRSISYSEHGTVLNYSVEKYVEQEEMEDQ